MLSIGDGIAISTVAISLGGYLIMLVKKRNGNGKRYLTKEEHDKECRLKQDNVDIRFANIQEDLKEIKDNIKTIAKYFNDRKII